jgi:pimeloyl-ACP methyl ester carboxylesterase
VRPAELGIAFQTDKPPGRYGSLAAAAEAGGFDVVSAFGDLLYQPPRPALLEMARATSRVRLGAACLNPFTQHPYEIAAGLAVLDAVAAGRVARAVLISSVPPLMVQTAANPGGLPKSVFDDLQAQLAANRSEFYRALPSGPFYGFNRPGVQPSETIIANWWRQGMTGGAKAHYDGIVAFSQTDFTDDLKQISVPVLVMHGDDDQIVPYADSGPLSAKLVQNGTLKTYHGFPHGMPTTQAETINADLLAWLRS